MSLIKTMFSNIYIIVGSFKIIIIIISFQYNLHVVFVCW